MHVTTDDVTMPSGSGNLANALDHIAGEGFDDDFLTGDDVTIAQIHSLASSKPSFSTPAPLTVPEPMDDTTAYSLPSPSPRTFTEETETTEPSAMKVAALPSPGRTTSNTSSMVSSEGGPPLTVSPLPKVSPRSNMSSPGRKPKSTIDPPSTSDAALKPRRPSGGLPRVAMLAANKPAPKKEETQRNTPPPFRAGGSGVRQLSSTASTSARGRSPGGTTGLSSSSRERLSGASASSSPVPAGGVSRSSSRSSVASGTSSSRLAGSSSINSRPAWGSTAAAGAPSRSASARSSGSPAPGTITRTPTGLRSSSTLSSRSTPPGAAGTTPTGAATRRTVSSSAAASAGAGRGRGRVVARSSSPSKIPSGPARSTSARSRPGAPGAAAVAGAVGAAAAVVDKPEKELSLDDLRGLMGEIKDIKHDLDMSTPTAADGAENAVFGQNAEAEESLPGPQFVASVDTGAETENKGVGDEQGAEVVDGLEKEESAEVEAENAEGDGETDGAADGAADAIITETDAVEKVDVEEPAAAVVVEEVNEEPPATARPAFEQPQEQQSATLEEEKIQAKPLCSCSIM